MAYALTFFIIVLADQLSKAVAYALDLENVTIIPNILSLDKLRNPQTGDLNTGMAYGLIGDKEWAMPVFIALTCVALVVFLIALVKIPKKKRFLRIAIVLIMTGAAGNLIDRIVLGGVRDFIHVSIGGITLFNYHCNIADVAITVGAIMFILALLFVDDDAVFRFKKKEEKEQIAEASETLGFEKESSDNEESVKPAVEDKAESDAEKKK